MIWNLKLKFWYSSESILKGLHGIFLPFIHSLIRNFHAGMEILTINDGYRLERSFWPI